MTREDLRQKYVAKREQLGLEAQWGREGERKVRLVQEHAVYAGMVEAMDAAVGVVLDALDRLGLSERTLVVFTSDNGGLSTSEGHPTSNLPFRGGKGWMYEGGIREPTIVRLPGTTEPGTVDQTVVTSPDWVPTILEVTGVGHAEGDRFDGVSLVPTLRGEPMDRGPVFWHYPHYGNQGGFPSAAVRDGRYKLIHRFQDDARFLFDLESDPAEQQDLSGAHPELVARLFDELKTWQEDVGARFPTPNPAFDPNK